MFLHIHICRRSIYAAGDRRGRTESIYIYIHTYIHTYIRMYVHTYIRIYIHTYIRIYIRMIHTYIHMYVYVYICYAGTAFTLLVKEEGVLSLYIYVWRYIYVLHTYIHTYIHTYTHTYIHIYIYIYMLCRRSVYAAGDRRGCTESGIQRLCTGMLTYTDAC